MIRGFDISPAVLSALVGAPSDQSGLRLLQAIKLSELRLSLVHLFRLLPQYRQETAEAFEVLFAIDRRDRPLLHDVLLCSWAGVWLRRCRQVLGAHPTGDRRLPLHQLAYLGQLAAVLALRGGIETDLTVVSATGSLMLPGLGLADTHQYHPTTWRLRVSGRALTVSAGEGWQIGPVDTGEMAGWLPLRRLAAVYRGQRFAACLDDLDPLRDCYRMPVASRLDDAAVAHWTELAQQAWILLVRHAPRRAAEVGAGLG